MRWRSRNKQDGFTVLEVLISIFLLVIISFAIYQSTTETYKLRDVLSHEGEFYNTVRLSMSVFQRDLENAYSPLTLSPEPTSSASPSPLGGGGGGSVDTEPQENTPNEYYASSRDRHGIRPSRLHGTESVLTWISSSNLRMYRDSRESEFLKVKYELVGEKDPDYPTGLKMLVRTVSPDAFEYDEDKDQSRKRYTLLHGIKSWKYRYYSREKKQWLGSWDSDSSDYKNLLPDLVEIQLEVEAPKGLNFSGAYQFRPETPLNGLPSTL